MKQHDFCKRLSFLSEYSLLTEEMRRSLHMTSHAGGGKYSVAKDSRIAPAFERKSLSNTVGGCFLCGVAFVIANGIEPFLKTPSPSQMCDIMKMLEYTNDGMIEFYKKRDDTTDIPIEHITNLSLAPVILVLTRAIRESFSLKGSPAKKSDKARLPALVEYLQEHNLLKRFEDEESVYEDFIVGLSEPFLKTIIAGYEQDEITLACDKLAASAAEDVYIAVYKERQTYLRNIRKSNGGAQLPLAASDGMLRVKLSETHLQGDYNLVSGKADALIEKCFEALRNGKPIDDDLAKQTSEYAPWFIPAINKVSSHANQKAALCDGFISKFDDSFEKAWESNNLKNKEMLLNCDSVKLMFGALSAILNGDEIINTHIGFYMWVKILFMKGFPVTNTPLTELEDDEEWNDDFFVSDSDLSLAVITNSDIVNYEEDSELKGPTYAASFVSLISGMPLTHPVYIRKSVVNYFVKLGLSKRKARDYAIVTSVLAQQYDSNEKSCIVESVFSEIEEKSTGLLSEKLLSETSARNEAEQQLSRAEQSLQDCRQESSILQRENAKLRKELELARVEINKREELLRLYDECGVGDTIEDQTDDETSNLFPFTTSLKLVLYGGFPNFHKEIVKYIPNLRIVEFGSRVDTSPLKSADLLFIQPNRMSHSIYWSIIDAAKANGTDYFHFRHASAKKCAEYIVSAVEKHEEKKARKGD